MMFKRRQNLSQPNLVKLAYNILLSLAFIHEANVMHRDFKPSNILVNQNYNVKICDFGVSRTVPKDNMGVEGFGSVHIRESYF